MFTNQSKKKMDLKDFRKAKCTPKRFASLEERCERMSAIFATSKAHSIRLGRLEIVIYLSFDSESDILLFDSLVTTEYDAYKARFAYIELIDPMKKRPTGKCQILFFPKGTTSEDTLRSVGLPIKMKE
jgi:hypothetical protein